MWNEIQLINIKNRQYIEKYKKYNATKVIQFIDIQSYLGILMNDFSWITVIRLVTKWKERKSGVR